MEHIAIVMVIEAVSEVPLVVNQRVRCSTRFFELLLILISFVVCLDQRCLAVPLHRVAGVDIRSLEPAFDVHLHATNAGVDGGRNSLFESRHTGCAFAGEVFKIIGAVIHSDLLARLDAAIDSNKNDVIFLAVMCVRAAIMVEECNWAQD